MKILLFRGSFSWDGENTHEGLICWCHIEPGDREKLETAARKILLKKNVNENIILVPFGHLSNIPLRYDLAKVCYDNLCKKFENAMCAPFGLEKALVLNVAADDTAVKLLTI